MIVVRAECSLASENPYGRVLNGSIILYASAMEVLYVKNLDRRVFEFHLRVSKADQPEPRVSVPVELEFSPDTPLGCHTDGSVSKTCIEHFYIGSCHWDWVVMPVLLLLVKCAENGDGCMLVCSLVRAAPEPNTCRRLGIGTIKRLHTASLSSRLVQKRFALI